MKLSSKGFRTIPSPAEISEGVREACWGSSGTACKLEGAGADEILGFEELEVGCGPNRAVPVEGGATIGDGALGTGA